MRVCLIRVGGEPEEFDVERVDVFVPHPELTFQVFDEDNTEVASAWETWSDIAESLS